MQTAWSHAVDQAFSIPDGVCNIADVSSRRFRMDHNRVEGTKHQIKGTAKEVVGKVTGNKAKEMAGKLEKNVGKFQDEVGKAADAQRDEDKNRH
jgi:uncharacterized protein YjbJ (UPF0337 family)